MWDSAKVLSLVQLQDGPHNIMEKYLVDKKSLITRKDQVFCVDDYGVESEIIPKKWYDIINETEKVYFIKNEWGEIETYSKKRFKRQKENLPIP